MSDARLRELERRWANSKSPEDEAAYLSEQVRAGALTEERVRLASYLGHPAARLVVPVDSPEVLEDWLHGLGAYPEDPRSRAAAALARSVFPVYLEVLDQVTMPNRAPLPGEALAALDRWIACPCVGCQETSLAAGEAVLSVLRKIPGGEFCSPRRAARAVLRAAWCVGWVSERTGRRYDSTSNNLPILLSLVATLRGESEQWSCVREELTPWALRRGDPVRDRLAGI